MSEIVDISVLSHQPIQKLLKADEVADILNVSRSKVYQLMQEGKIRSVNIGSLKRVRLIDLNSYIEKNVTAE